MNRPGAVDVAMGARRQSIQISHQVGILSAGSCTGKIDRDMTVKPAQILDIACGEGAPSPAIYLIEKPRKSLPALSRLFRHVHIVVSDS